MPDMFCFQCQQTAGNSGCVRVGVCGKQPETANLQDDLVYALIRLALAAEQSGKRTHEAGRLMADGLFTTLTNVNFDNGSIRQFIQRVAAEERKLGGYDGKLVELWKGDTDTVSLRSTLLFGLKGMAAYAHHCMNLGYEDPEVTGWFYRGLSEINREHTVEQWLALIMEFGQINLKCMALLDAANTETFGSPVPTRVNVDIKKGPFIVVSGHDLKDLFQLLEQTKDKGINIYTHSEMLPAHGYPELKKYPHQGTLHKEVCPDAVPVSENHSIRTAWRLLCRLFLALPHGVIVGQILPFQRFRVGCYPRPNGIVMDVHPLMTLSAQLVGLEHHNFVDKLVDYFWCQFRQPGHLPGPLNEPL